MIFSIMTGNRLGALSVMFHSLCVLQAVSVLKLHPLAVPTA